jgi:hypothetical protein
VNVGEKADRLNEALRDAEDALDSMQLGVSASVPLGASFLRFAKSGAVWQLLVVDESNGLTPLLKTSLATRVAAAERLGDLMNALAHEQEGMGHAIEQATLRARSFATHVRENFGAAPSSSKDSDT